jgi:hypothetical protein
MAIETFEERRDPDRRRRRRHRLAFPDRRTGFDRRNPESGSAGAWYQRTLKAYRENPRTLLLALAMFNLLNLADLMLTYRSLLLGASEVNPIMKSLFDIHPIWAGIIKMGVGAIVSEAIWALRRHRSALVLSIGLVTGMAALFIYHLFISQSLPI